MDSLHGLREAVLGLQPGVSSGNGAVRSAYMMVLAKRMEDEDMERLKDFGISMASCKNGFSMSG